MEQLHIRFQNILIAIIVLSGTLNNFINAYLLNINFTLLTLIIVVLDIFFNLFIRKIQVSKTYFVVFSILLAFYGLIIISLIYSPSSSYKYTKATNFIINILLFSYPVFVKKIKLGRIIKIIKIFSVALGVFFIYERYRYWLPSNFYLRGLENNNTFFVFNVVYLGIGVNLSLVLIYESFKKKWLSVVLLLCLMIGMGSRGSFLFSAATILTFHYKYFIKTILKFKVKKKQLYFLCIILIGLSIVLYRYYDKISDIVKIGIGRFQSLLNISEDKSSLGRLNHYSLTLEYILSTPFTIFIGFGIGSFGLVTNGQDMRWYPHNIFLEAWFEMGIFGMLMLMLVIFIPVFIIRGKFILKAMFMFLFLEAMKSSNITDLWVFFLILGLLLVYKEETINQNKLTND
ncbi:hypothetical protein BTO05_08550 [Winogradskyella sp. PC-19]|uniref:O-antigen ligase family protein n=1 Tax=Winogradskyella sp. PC-19 TaxID=754417 RepID=UPI000B3D0ABD|nr:O-antigen ligase family protein [Winogradskyella sp. PC-19]ARV09689.1 hypothetical protein BTO05_08550 [Winogradskyella sp. PC-19]